MALLQNLSTNNEAVDTNVGTHDGIAQDAGATDCMEFSSEEQANIHDSKTSSLEDSVLKYHLSLRSWWICHLSLMRGWVRLDNG